MLGFASGEGFWIAMAGSDPSSSNMASGWGSKKPETIDDMIQS
jgi:hypothetical protein